MVYIPNQICLVGLGQWRNTGGWCYILFCFLFFFLLLLLFSLAIHLDGSSDTSSVLSSVPVFFFSLFCFYSYSVLSVSLYLWSFQCFFFLFLSYFNFSARVLLFNLCTHVVFHSPFTLFCSYFYLLIIIIYYHYYLGIFYFFLSSLFIWLSILIPCVYLSASLVYLFWGGQPKLKIFQKYLISSRVFLKAKISERLYIF